MSVQVLSKNLHSCYKGFTSLPYQGITYMVGAWLGTKMSSQKRSDLKGKIGITAICVVASRIASQRGWQKLAFSISNIACAFFFATIATLLNAQKSEKETKKAFFKQGFTYVGMSSDRDLDSTFQVTSNNGTYSITTYDNGMGFKYSISSKEKYNKAIVYLEGARNFSNLSEKGHSPNPLLPNSSMLHPNQSSQTNVIEQRLEERAFEYIEDEPPEYIEDEPPLGGEKQFEEWIEKNGWNQQDTMKYCINAYVNSKTFQYQTFNKEDWETTKTFLEKELAFTAYAKV